MLTLVTAPSLEPVTLTEAKDWLRVDTNDDNTLIQTLLKAARTEAEDFQNRAYLQQTWKLTCDAFPSVIELWRCPVTAVTSIAYVDTSGASQGLDPSQYTVDTLSEPARITPAFGLSWPSTRRIANAVTITFVAGYGTDRLAVPEPEKNAIKLRVADLYEHRESVVFGQTSIIPHTFHALLSPKRLMEVV